jgi:ribose 5-phosphate isomerase B
MNTKTIAVGADDLALDLKARILDYLRERFFIVEDFGVQEGDHTAYPDIAYSVSMAVARGAFSRGILLCGTGIGMAITANKIPGIRAAVCHDLYSAERSRLSNDCQILTMGSRVISPDFAESILDVWLHAEFKNGRSTPKLQRISEIEDQFTGAAVEPVHKAFG